MLAWVVALGATVHIYIYVHGAAVSILGNAQKQVHERRRWMDG